MTAQHKKIGFRVLVLEDEEEVAKHIERDLAEKLQSSPLARQEREAPAFGEACAFEFDTQVVATDNVTNARKILKESSVDLLIADHRVKADRDSRKADTTAHALLSELRRSGRFLPVVAHSAFPRLSEEAQKDGCVDVTISKRDFDSTEKVITQSAEMAAELLAFKRDLLGSFAMLKCAAATASPIDRQRFLKGAREGFGDLTACSLAPPDYRKGLLVLCSFLMRLSSVPSAQFGLKPLSLELVDLLEPLVRRLSTPNFNYDRDAVAVFEGLEANGYDVILRVEDV
ncbi:MAG: hypothetical protein KJ000_06010 [Pirellulaceae bacterium]|nr:hypothetical protein [Pirellulaceae bacterium]